MPIVNRVRTRANCEITEQYSWLEVVRPLDVFKQHPDQHAVALRTIILAQTQDAQAAADAIADHFDRWAKLIESETAE